MRQKKIVLITSMLMAVLLMGCKPSAEKISQAQGVRDQLVEVRSKAEETYLDIADTSLRPELDSLGVQVAEFADTDFSEVSSKKIDEEITKMTELVGQYEEVQSKLDGTYSEEASVKQEEARHLKINTYIINKMGFDLSSIKLYDMNTDTYSENYLVNGEILSNGYTLMGIVMEVNADSTDWVFVVKSTTDTEYTIPLGDLRELTDGASLTFEYDNESSIASVSTGGYFSE
nr:hypothetical protein [uncultured Butyrivibrio sp.]